MRREADSLRALPGAIRIGVANVQHESCGFIAGAQSPAGNEVTLSDFRAAAITDAEALSLGDANSAADGVVSGVRSAGAEPVPLMFIEPKAAGQPTPETLRSLVEELLAAVDAAGPLDGVALALHGGFSASVAGVSTEAGAARHRPVFGDDADGELLAALRARLGPEIPIVASHDMHANVSARTAQAADALCIIRTYPHVDSFERGAQAARLAVAAARREVRPTTAWRGLPLLWSAARMIDAQRPMAAIRQRLEQLEQTNGVLAAGVHTGYQWVDSPTVAAGVVVTTDDDTATAAAHAESLASWIWEQRADLLQPPLRPAAALEAADAVGRYPVVLADQADNTGGGAPGDSTELLRLFIERNLDPSLVLYLVDPEAAAIAHRAGTGSTVDLTVGGKSSSLVGPPVALRAEVVALGDGEFTYDGPMRRGKPGRIGPSAWLRAGGVSVVVTSVRAQPMDTAFCRTLGIDVAAFRYIAVKSTGHFRSGFGPLAAQIFNVDAAGVLSHDFSALPYERLRGVYPLDQRAAPGWARRELQTPT